MSQQRPAAGRPGGGPFAVSVLPEADIEQASSADEWPPTGLDLEQIWDTPAGTRRIPAADRNHRYRPSLPAMIAHRDVPLDSDMAARAEEAALRLRSADEGVADGASTIPLLRSESAASSKIEQIEVGQRYIGRALADLPTRPRSALEVASNVRAVQSAVEGDLQSTPADRLHEIHAELLPDQEWAGKPRTMQNWIGGSDYSPRDARHVPPRPGRVPELLDDLAAFVSRNDIPAVVQAAIAHAQFETIHPYRDGNGRVGRALAHMILRRRRVTVNAIAPLSIAILGDRDRYLNGLEAYEHGRLGTWLSYFIRASTTAADSTARLSQQLTGLHDEWRNLAIVADSRSDAAIRSTVDQLTSHPVCSTSQLAERLGVSRPAARRALQQLTEVGVLNRTTAARNLQIYEAHEVFAAIDDVERAFTR